MHIRGEITLTVTMRGKSGGDNFIQLTKCITQLDATYDASPSPVIYEERLSLQVSLRT